MSGDLHITQVANYFIEKSWEHNKPLTFIKLTDLLWQANGFWLALTNRPLFSEQFRNSQNGVLLLSVFDTFGKLKNKSINTTWYKDTFYDDNISSEKIKSKKYQIFLSKIWEMFAHFPQDFLRYLSNNIYKYNKFLNEYSEIDNNIVYKCFKDELQRLNALSENFEMPRTTFKSLQKQEKLEDVAC